MADRHGTEQARMVFGWQAHNEALLGLLADAGCTVAVEGDGADRLQVVATGSRRQVRNGLRALEAAARVWGARQGRAEALAGAA